jgi:hypothetical protein
MRKLIFLPLISMGLLLLTQSCSKQSQEDMGVQTMEAINATVSVSNPYVLILNNYGEANISKQAAHFDLSKTELSGENGVLAYKYIPKAGFTGADEVELVVSKKAGYRSGGGCSNTGGSGSSGAIYTTTGRILIKFTVTN